MAAELIPLLLQQIARLVAEDVRGSPDNEAGPLVTVEQDGERWVVNPDGEIVSPVRGDCDCDCAGHVHPRPPKQPSGGLGFPDF